MTLYRPRVSARGRWLSRDELVTRGMRAGEIGSQSHSPWIYKTVCKSGRKGSIAREYQAYNIPHLKALIIMDQAREDETLTAMMIGRIMKSHLRSRREDY